MKLSEIFEQLEYGELRKLFMGVGAIGGTGDMPTETYKKLFPTIKRGLTELHKRFLLREAETTVTLVDGTANYTVSPAANDLMKIERIYGTYLEEEYQIPLNDVDCKYGIRTTSRNTIVVPTDSEDAPWLLETTELRVVYRADHAAINANLATNAPSVVEIDLPDTHLDALLFFVASRAHNPEGSIGEFHAGNNYQAKFERACQLLKDYNMQIDSNFSECGDKLMNRGFV